MAAIAEYPTANQPTSDAEDTGKPESTASSRIPSFPTGRVKRIMKLDRDIKKVNSEALLLMSLSTQLFVEFLTERAGTLASRKQRKTIKLEHLRAAIADHTPTSDFLLDCLPEPAKPSRPQSAAHNNDDLEKTLPAGVRRIDEFFSKPAQIPQ